LLFNLAAQALNRAEAEEVVQDVFLAIWRHAARFSPELGSARSLALQIAHYRIANELRRKRRRPQTDDGAEPEDFTDLPDDQLDPADQAWRQQRSAVLHEAVRGLPPLQREAVGLAFFDELTHPEVAARLDVPLGTAKTRIRDGLQKLRGSVAVLVAAVAIAAAGMFIYRFQTEREQRSLDERALALVTSSDAQSMRMTAVPGAPDTTHAVYHGRVGAPIALVTFSNFDPPTRGAHYALWAKYGDRWVPLGTFQPDPGGTARLIAESPELTELPAALQVTEETSETSGTPRGPVVVQWPG
jgi:RNA polymerase sigma-70 factor (ECF subfamily)